MSRNLIPRISRALINYNELVWTNQDIVDLIDLAVKDISVKSKCIRRKILIPFAVNITEYVWPEAIQYFFATFNGKPLELKTIQYMSENFGTDWKSDTGVELTHIVYDEYDNYNSYSPVSNRQTLFRTYPKISDSTIVDSAEVYIYAHLRNPELSFPFNEEEILINDIYNTAIVFYVLGNAFSQSKKEQIQSLGKYYLGRYDSTLEMIKGNKNSASFSFIETNYETGL
jgi:hypothetical protein